MKKLSSYLCLTFAFKVCVFIFFVLISGKSSAQITPANCTAGCTSNDVQIQRAYLSNQAGTILPNNFVCPASGTASVYLTLELTTKTPRVGVTIFTKIKTFTPPSTIGAEVSGSPISQCFGITLNQPTNKVTFQAPFNWTCGTAIVMTDIFIGWGTGNTNFCTGSSFQCPATPSKCYSLPPGSFVAIETPSSQNGSATLCSDALGGTSATFNLNNINVTSSSNVTITWWENYTAPSTFSNQILSPASYSSGTKTIYAKITSNSDASVFSVSTVTLTVNQTPNLSLHNPAALCSPNTADLTAAAVTAGSVIPANATLSYWTNAGATTAVSNPAAVGAGTYYIKATCNTTPVCSDIKSVTVTVNPNLPASVSIGVAPSATICAGTSLTFTATPTNGGASPGYQWKKNGGTISGETGSTYTTSTLVNGDKITVVMTSNATPCLTGSPATSNEITITVNTAPPTPSTTYHPPACDQTTFSVEVTNVVSGATYTIKKGDGSSFAAGVVTPSNPIVAASNANITFSGIPAGSGFQVSVSKAGCSPEGAALPCTSSPSSARITTTTATIEFTESQTTTVKAYPNPFSDKVKFLVTSADGGKGSLEVYNMMGQKVKTVYTGFISAGTQTFELSLPNQQVANLVYVLRIGDKKTTGKILQINR